MVLCNIIVWVVIVYKILGFVCKLNVVIFMFFLSDLEKVMLVMWFNCEVVDNVNINVIIFF